MTRAALIALGVAIVLVVLALLAVRFGGDAGWLP